MGLLSKRALKALIEKPLRMSKDFHEAMDSEVRRIIEKAKERVIANKKKTLRPCDV